MKRIVSFMVLAAFLVTMAFPAVAAEPPAPISRDEAMETAREEIQVPDSYVLNNISYRYEPNGLQVWSFNWNSGDNNKPGDMWVEVDAATGKIRSFNHYSPDNYREGKYSMTEAQAIADQFLREMNPDEYAQLRPEPPVVPDIGIQEKLSSKLIREDRPLPAMDYYFRYNRIVNGYPYFDNYMNVSVSSSTGKVISYSSNWDNEVLPVVDSVVYRTYAQDTFFEKTGFGLGYLRIWEQGNVSPEGTLGYYMQNPYYQVFVDAVTGKAIDYSGRILESPDPLPVINAASQPAPASGSLTMEEAMALAKKWANVPDDYIINGSSYNENPRGITPSTWNFTWTKFQKGHINVGINAETGEVTNMDAGYEPYYNPKAEITEEEAVKIAVDFILQAAPSKANQLRRNPQYLYGEYPEYKPGEKRPNYNINFTRLLNGLPVADNGATVNVNGEGKVTSFWLNWEDVKFPSTDDIISAEKAAGLVTRKMNMELGYVRIMDGQGGWEPRLVYRFNYDNALYVDAKTGEVKNRWGPILYSQAKFSDAAGHWAEKDIRQLVELKVIDPAAGSYRPEDKITRGDMVAFISKALQLTQYFPDKPTFEDVAKEDINYGYIEAAYKEGLIKGVGGKFDPQAPITREQLAVILAKAFNSLPADDKINLEKFADSGQISDWAKDGVLVTAKLGLITGDNKSNFNPRESVTRAEAAAITARAVEGLTQ